MSRKRSPRLLSLNTYNYRRGGSDAAFLEHDRIFADMGWNTARFAMHHPRNDPSPWSEYFVDELEFGSDYGLAQKLLMAGKVIYSLEAQRKLKALLSAWRPDVAHSHCLYHHISPSVLPVLRRAGIPTVLTAHDLKLACPAYKMLNRTGVCERCKGGNLLNVVRYRCLHESLSVSALIMVESFVHRLLSIYRKNLDRIIVPSRFYGAKLQEWGWSDEQIVHIPNFIDCSRFKPDFDPGDYFLYFGRLAPEKGVATLIRAAKQSAVPLKIAGIGPSEQTLRETALGGKQIEFLGHQSGESLWSLVRNARAVILPSEWYENAPLSLLEAYASGTIVIGADIGGISEMVRHDETGFLFPAADTERLSDRLTDVASMPPRRLQSMARAGREFANATFNRERYVNDTLELYRSLGVELAS